MISADQVQERRGRVSIHLNRRKFLKLLGLGGMGALLTTCKELSATPGSQKTSQGIPGMETTTPPQAPGNPTEAPPTATMERVATVTKTPTESVKTAEKPTEYEVWRQIPGYANPGDESPFGNIDPGKTFTVLEERDGWLKIRTPQGGDGWIKEAEGAYGPVGTRPPETQPPEGNFPREIVLANGQLEMHNQGRNWGLRVSQYAKGSDGKLIMGQEGRDINIGKIEAMFTKYSGGRKLRIYFYDSFEEYDKVVQGRGRKTDLSYRFGQRTSDGAVELYIGVHPNFVSQGNLANDRILCEVNDLGLAAFLIGREDTVIDYALGPAFPEDIQKNILFPAILTVYP